MKPDRAILVLGGALWLRLPEGWRVFPGLPVPGQCPELIEALRRRGARASAVVVYEPEGLSHARASGVFGSREEFRESLRNRQRFPALVRDDLAWGFDPDRQDSRATECHVHSECVPGLERVSEVLDQTETAVAGAWSLWSVLRSAETLRDPGVLGVVVAGNFAAVAWQGQGSHGPFFRAWCGPWGESMVRGIVSVVGELIRNRTPEGDGSKPTLHVYCPSDQDTDACLLTELAAHGAVARRGLDELVDSVVAQRLAPSADLLRSFPRTVRLDRPILRAAIAAAVLFAGVAGVAAAKERKLSAESLDDDAAQRKQAEEILHRTGNRRLIEQMGDSSAGPHPLLAGCMSRLAPSLPSTVVLTEVSVDKAGAFRLRGRSAPQLFSVERLGAALKSAGWNCRSIDQSAGGAAWAASGELLEGNHGS